MPYGRPSLKFHDCYVVDEKTGCWVWQKGLTVDGYPRFHRRLATRWALMNLGIETEGPWLACHACNNKLCVRPGDGHLYAGTAQENQRDSMLAGTFGNLLLARDKQWSAQSREERIARTRPGINGIRSWWAGKTPEERTAIARERALARWRPTIQTFLPYPNFASSAMVLDRLRLNKQVLEARQILSALSHGGGWRNHPAVKMWHGHSAALKFYHDAMLREWLRRGYKSTQSELLPRPAEDWAISLWADAIIMPSWLGDEQFHASHRAALLAKDPRHYQQFGWAETPVIAYIWPSALATARATG